MTTIHYGDCPFVGLCGGKDGAIIWRRWDIVNCKKCLDKRKEYEKHILKKEGKLRSFE